LPITREAAGSNGALVTFTANGSDVEQGTIAASCSPASGSTFPVGTTTVSCTVTDVAHATASGSFTVTVRDTTAPVVTAASVTFEQTSPAGAVATFASSASDLVDGSVATTCSPASGTTFARGATTVTCSATDAHGNSASTTATVTVRDTIKPVVTYSGQVAAYDVSQTIAITCAATDSGSGVASTTCANVNTSASNYTVGSHTLSATATDVAGNVGQASVSFTVTVSASSLQALITQIIGDSSVAGPLNTKLAQAATAPNATAKAGHLQAFENQVNAQSGKKLTAAQAALLLQLVQSLY
jgi:hypothetical protein